MRILPFSPWKNWVSIVRIKPVPTISTWVEKLDTSILAAPRRDPRVVLRLEAVEPHAATRGSKSLDAEEAKSMNLRNHRYRLDPPLFYKNQIYLRFFLSYQRWNPSGDGNMAPLQRGARSHERAFLSDLNWVGVAMGRTLLPRAC